MPLPSFSSPSPVSQSHSSPRQLDLSDELENPRPQPHPGLALASPPSKAARPLYRAQHTMAMQTNGKW
jgi:hypothetical protein